MSGSLLDRIVWLTALNTSTSVLSHTLKVYFSLIEMRARGDTHHFCLHFMGKNSDMAIPNFKEVWYLHGSRKKRKQV